MFSVAVVRPFKLVNLTKGVFTPAAHYPVLAISEDDDGVDYYLVRDDEGDPVWVCHGIAHAFQIVDEWSR